MIKALTLTCQEVLRYKKHHHEEWVSIETLGTIRERESNKIAVNNRRTRAEEVRAQAEYTEANKKITRADKQKYVGKLAPTAEKAARERNIRQLYERKYSKPERPGKDKEGKSITEIR
ncbi:unnamed protein product [Schistosoma mattheei]|uniref:Uncharacterized protein n=1 Tax=Schistosoma mattheei TaxID=31246 RepID=A0A183P7Y9_9TREM|nr:unnamed protein product [Schistosoma mattheei]